MFKEHIRKARAEKKRKFETNFYFFLQGRLHNYPLFNVLFTLLRDGPTPFPDLPPGIRIMRKEFRTIRDRPVQSCDSASLFNAM